MSEVLSDEDIRLEEKYYSSKRPTFKSVKGEEIEFFSQYGTSKDLNEEGLGFPVLRLNEFESFFISKPAKYCNLIDYDTYVSLQLKKNDVLICRTNGNPKYVGKAAIVPKDYDYAFASYLFRVRPNSNLINSATLVTFLNSDYGRKEIEKFSMVSNQANFSPAKFRKISIPLFSYHFNKTIEETVYRAYDLFKNSNSLYIAAEDQLLSELGLKGWQPNNNNINVKTLKESFLSSGRLDAEYYQSKYDELQHKLKAYRDGYMNLSAIANTYRGNFISEEMYCDDVNCRAYIRGADISSNILTNDKCVYIDKKFVQTHENTCLLNDIVIALIGSVGTAARITEEYVGSYISNNLGLIRITNDRIKSEYLHLFLTSQYIGKYFFEQKEMRTAQPKISDKDIWDFPIPLLSQSIQESICVKIQQSFALKAESKRLLEEAKMMVEQEIEKGGK